MMINPCYELKWLGEGNREAVTGPVSQCWTFEEAVRAATCFTPECCTEMRGIVNLFSESIVSHLNYTVFIFKPFK
jgi:hypothetical protein